MELGITFGMAAAAAGMVMHEIGRDACHCLQASWCVNTVHLIVHAQRIECAAMQSLQLYLLVLTWE